MNAEVFVDTNVLLYSIDDDPAHAPKRQRAQGCGKFSWRILRKVGKM
jgi:predicted nucleic acid-binding protein